MKEINRSKLRSSWKNDRAIMTIKEQIIYINLVKSCCDASERTRISSETIAENIHSSVEVVNKCLDNLEKNGFIKKCQIGWEIVKPCNYEYFFRDFLGKVSGTATAVAFRLASCRTRMTSLIEMKDVEIIKQIGISKPTFIKARKELIEKGVLNDLFGCYQLSTNCFPLLNHQLSEELEERSRALIYSAKKGFKGGEVYKYYAQRDFRDLQYTTPDKFLYWCEAGCPGMKSRKTTFGGAPYEIDERKIDTGYEFCE